DSGNQMNQRSIILAFAALVILPALTRGESPNPALTSAKRDAQRATQSVQAATDRAANLVTQMKAAEQTLVSAQAAKAGADKLLADSTAALKSAEATRSNAEKSAQDLAATAKKT